MYIINETTSIGQNPKFKKLRSGKVRFECILQDTKVNRNKRLYERETLNDAINKVSPIIKERSFTGELDHPLDTSPARQCNVLLKESSHRFLEIGWDGDKIVGVLESISTPNGRILRDLIVEDKFPVGFSFRGMGSMTKVYEGNNEYYKINAPLHPITWDCVSRPSHPVAKLIRVTESVIEELQENNILNENVIFEQNGYICTSGGMCFLPNAFDKLIETRVKRLQKKYSL